MTVDGYKVKGLARQERRERQRRAMRLNGRSMKALLVERAAKGGKR